MLINPDVSHCFQGLCKEDNESMFNKLAEQEMSELGFNLSMVQGREGRESSSTGTKIPIELDPLSGIVRLALRDTLVKGWLRGLKPLSVSEMNMMDQFDSKLEEAVYEASNILLKLSILSTSNVVA
jgi:hypothetical protein